MSYAYFSGLISLFIHIISNMICKPSQASIFTCEWHLYYGYAQLTARSLRRKISWFLHRMVPAVEGQIRKCSTSILVSLHIHPSNISIQLAILGQIQHEIYQKRRSAAFLGGQQAPAYIDFCYPYMSNRAWQCQDGSFCWGHHAQSWHIWPCCSWQCAPCPVSWWHTAFRCVYLFLSEPSLWLSIQGGSFCMRLLNVTFLDLL